MAPSFLVRVTSRVYHLTQADVASIIILLFLGSPFLAELDQLDLLQDKRDVTIRLPVDEIATLAIDSRCDDACDVIDRMSVTVSCRSSLAASH